MSPPKFFTDAAAFREWLGRNGTKVPELQVGFYHVASGKPSITYKEALDEALCAGWIDGIRKKHGPNSYTVRFSPRTSKSVWSVVNTKRAKELIADGRMLPAGRAAFDKRDERKTTLVSPDAQRQPLAPAYERQLRANKKAWAFYQTLTPYLQRMAVWWIMSAKLDKTREARLAQLIDTTERGELPKGFEILKR